MELPTDCEPVTGNSNVAAILDAANTRWLTVEEIITLLPNGGCGPFLPNQIAPPSKPPTSGTVLLYNRFAVRNYKKDGHDWIRKPSNPAKIREDHVKLRYNGTYRVGGNYVHSDETDTLHRRVYRLIKTAEEKAASGTKEEFVLVHYLDTEEAAKISMKGVNSSQPPSSIITSGTKRLWDNDDKSSPYSNYNSYMHHDPSSNKKIHIGSTAGYNYVDAIDQEAPPLYCAPDANMYQNSNTLSFLPTMMHACASIPTLPSTVTPPILAKEVEVLDSVSFDVLCQAIDADDSGIFTTPFAY